MALAAVGTFVAYGTATSDDSIEVLVATRALRVGHTITADDVDLVAVDLPNGVRGLFGAVDAATGRQLVAAVDEGEFLLASATSTPIDGDEHLEVTISLPRHRAVGDLGAGERVDVFSTWGGDVTELIAVDARVLGVSGEGDNVISESDRVVVRLALTDFGQVEAIVHAQAAGDITMVRAALGTAVEDVGREYRPLTRTPSSDGDSGVDEGTDGDDG